MFSSGKNTVAKALMGQSEKPVFAGKTKGSSLNAVPSVDPALKALAFNRRKKIKLG